MRASLRWIVTTALIGGLLGFIVSSLAGQLINDSGVLGQHESPYARAFIDGVIQNEPELLLGVSPKVDVVSRAMRYKASEQRQGPAGHTPQSVTYLGGRSQGGLQVEVYVIELRDARGQVALLPFALTLVNGKVIRIA